MNEKLRVLIVEDSEDDTILLIRELRKGGYDIVYERVENAESMKAALEQQQWDLIIADYILPNFSGPAAMNLIKESDNDLPLIIVSGNIGEDIAVSAMKAGAQDYIIKGKLKRLVPAVERELREAEIRRGRKLAEKTIREQSDILNSIFKYTITPLVLFDRDFNFIRVNQAYAKSCARSVSEFKGHNHFEFYPNEENEAIFRKVVESKFSYQTIAKPFIFPDHPEWGVTYWDWTLTPLLDDYGEVRFLVFALNDVTERKRAEEAVRAAGAYNRSLIEASLDPLVTISSDGKITDVNSSTEKITGYSRQELIGTDFSIYFVESDKARAGYQEVFRKGSVHDYSLEVRHKDGHITPVLYNASVYLDEAGNVQGIFAAARDITESKKKEEQIRFTSKLLQLFVTKTAQKEYLDSVVDLLHEWTECECIGVRILDKMGNIPYESYRGFSKEFWEEENWISVKNHQCACIRVVLQKPDPQDMNMMTPNGSFHCNNTEEFAGLLTQHELSRYRGLCIRTGFKSVAIVPIIYKGSVLGALHIADRREGMVPMEKIEFMESVAPIIGEAIFRFSAEEALVKNEASLSEAQRIALMGNWEWDIVNNKLNMSDELYRIFGLDPREFQANYEAFVNFVHPDERENVKDSVTQSVLKREPLDIDFRFIRTDGVVRVMHARGETVYDQSGEPLIVKGTGQDITERVQAEEALAESEERYRMLVDTMNEGLGMDDENGFLVYANDRLCDMLGYSRDEIIGRPVLSFFDERNKDILREQIEKRKRGESKPYRIEWTGKDGKKIITLLSPKGIFDTDGVYKGSFAVITDITEKLRLESIAEAINTMKNIGFIFSGIRHEIGNPVNSIKMALSVLKQNIDSYSKDTIKEYADRMLSEIVRMEYLLKAMKNFNMYETVELVDTDMTDFMNKFLSLVKGDFEKRGIKVDANVSETAWCYADPRALQQVLLNIMTNAADALGGREDPRITINVSKMADMVNIRVADNGSGMSEDQQEDLFKPFYTSKAKGTGLGLVITKKMMTKMKGFIEVVSEKDKGTIVDLYIPEGISEKA